jgi:Domain of unknown function (DUF4918)
MAMCHDILSFLNSLRIDLNLPKAVNVLNPYQDQLTFSFCEKFYRKFYSDTNTRTLIIGINPGRLGGGLTGIPFTDPIKLQERCGFENPFPKRAELSADFIHLIIDASGGLDKFYSQFYFSSVSPLGFTQNGKNLNYYDIPELQKILKPFIIKSMQTQLGFGLNTDICFVLGEGKNFAYVQSLNEEFRFFKKILPLPHPRFIMQYKRKQLGSYIQQYLNKLQGLEL